ncbi:MAG: M48 family metalloprotease [Deltaproteobacteria bacterium]|nr:M48 family metalloprotease [Deltaproteobacteria bacterium]
MKTETYTEKCEKEFRRTVLLATLILTLPAMTLFLKPDHYLSIIFDSRIVLHLCHFLKTALPSTLNLIFLIAALVFIISLPLGLLRSFYHFVQGITYPAFLKPLVSDFSRIEKREFRWEGNYRIIEIDSHVPFALAGGVIKKKIIVSKTLRQLLSPEEYDAVLMHEAGHLRMNHPIKRVLISSILRSLYILPARKDLWHKFRSLTELAADEYAVRTGARPATLASAIVKVAKEDRSVLASPISGFTSSQIKERIHALLGIEEGRENRKGMKKRFPITILRAVPALLFLLFIMQPFLRTPDASYCMKHTERPKLYSRATTMLSVCTEINCGSCEICSPAHRKHHKASS